MRVLLINSRPDAAISPGGDTIQAQKTAAALGSLDVVAELRASDELLNPPGFSLGGFDLAHIFNIQEPEPAWAVLEALERAGVPVVLSPIYWDMLAYWFEMAVIEKVLWRRAAGLLGKRLARTLYLAWQQLKAPSNPQWQVQRRLLRRARRVLPNSKSEAELLQRFFKLGADFLTRVDVVPNAIDIDLYQTRPSPSQDFLAQYGVCDFVLQVGTVNPVKNQLGLIDALYDLPTPLVFIGPVQPAYREYAQACKQRGAQRGRVIFIDGLSHDQLPGIYALAAVHALPSWRETPGLVSLEAAAAGCRIVTTSIGSTRDYFGDQAWYCYPNDPASIRAAVEAALAASPSETLRRRVLSDFTWQRAAQATLQSYQRAFSHQAVT